MARIPYIKEEVEIPSGVDVTVRDGVVEVKGPKGTIVKDFSHAKSLIIRKDGNKVVVETYFAGKKERALIKTIASKINNMIIGVQKGFRYKMKIVYAHYPMSVKVDKSKGLVIIENFLGEKNKRYAKILPGVTVRVEKDDVIVEGIDVEAVGQTAANIHLATHLTGKQRLSPHGREGGPGILDGIYLYEKEIIS